MNSAHTSYTFSRTNIQWLGAVFQCTTYVTHYQQILRKTAKPKPNTMNSDSLLKYLSWTASPGATQIMLKQMRRKSWAMKGYRAAHCCRQPLVETVAFVPAIGPRHEQFEYWKHKKLILTVACVFNWGHWCTFTSLKINAERI